MSKWICLRGRKPEASGFYLVTVATDDGACVRSLEFDKKSGNWIDEGEPTFCHSYYFRPTHWQELPEPAEILEEDEDEDEI